MADKIALKTLDRQDWATPDNVFSKLNDEFNFTLDAAASHNNAKCKLYYTKENCGLSNNWFGNVFVNPPFNNWSLWVVKAVAEVAANRAKTVVMLLPARTDTRAFHDYIYKKPYAEVRFIKGRLKFKGAKNSAPFPSMIVIFTKNDNP